MGASYFLPSLGTSLQPIFIYNLLQRCLKISKVFFTAFEFISIHLIVAVCSKYSKFVFYLYWFLLFMYDIVQNNCIYNTNIKI